MPRKPPFITTHPAGYAEARKRELVRGHCFHVVDGDTSDFMLDLGWLQYTYVALRLARINTAELHGSSARKRGLALRARTRVIELLYDQPALIRSERQVKTFDRFVAEVYFQMKETIPSTVHSIKLGGCRWVNLSDVLLAEKVAEPVARSG